ncbi:MAG: tetratricopeptide repeat protein, partial [Methylocella sp.]
IKSAAELLDKAIAKDPNYAPAYAQRGIAALLLSEKTYGELGAAEADAQGKLYLDKALQLDPNLAEAYAGIGLYHVNRPTENPQAIEALQKALAINPNLIDASNWLQTAYVAQGDNRKALEIAEDMIARDPLYSPGLANAISLYNEFDMQEKSWALIDRLRPFLAGDFSLTLVEANTWISLGNYSKAIPLLESLLKMLPSSAYIRSNLGIALIQTGQFERVVEIGDAPQQSMALFALGRQEEALTIATKLAHEGDVGWLIDQLGRTGQHEKLIEFVESRWPDLAAFENQYPDGAGIFFSRMLHIAAAYAKVGKADRFNDAMAQVRAVQERAVAQRIEDLFYLVDEARYLALSGDHEGAIVQLTKMV